MGNKALNFDLNKAGDLQKLQIFELEELGKEAYEKCKDHKRELRFFKINIS